MKKILLYMMTVTMLTMSVGAKESIISYVQMSNMATADSEDGNQTDVKACGEEKEEVSKAGENDESAETITDNAEELSGTVCEENEERREREQLVNYALQFVGGSYRQGGNDPHTGVDCSGFIRYVMANGAGISMYRSSREQATQGVSISADQMQPGDLLFYSNGTRINHVAMYIGDGRVVHASTEETGIKTSIWNYRTPVRIVSMFG